MQITTTLHQKAQGFVDDGNVTRIKGGAYVVVGSTGTPYSVWLADPEQVSGKCECPATTSVCSHLLAASIFALVNPEEETVKVARDPFEGLGV